MGKKRQKFKRGRQKAYPVGFTQKKGRKRMTTYKKPQLLESVNTSLRFNPYSWAKLKYLCQKGDTEIAGFGITGEDPFVIEDFVLVGQEASAAFVSMDDDAVADYLPEMVEKGFQPNQCMRIWIHTHPGSSPNPSGQDETTFSDIFGPCDYSIMFILARHGDVYCRLQVKNPHIQCLLPVYVDYTLPFQASSIADWDAEYDENVKTRVYSYNPKTYGKGGIYDDYYGDDVYDRAWDGSGSRYKGAGSTPKLPSAGRRMDLAGQRFEFGYYDLDGAYIPYNSSKSKYKGPVSGPGTGPATAKSGTQTYPKQGRKNFVTEHEKRQTAAGKGGTTEAVARGKRGKK